MVMNLEEDILQEEQQIQQHGIEDLQNDADITQHVSRLRYYGDVHLCTGQPIFVMRARRESDRSNVYINLCTCAEVPFNTVHGVENETVIYLLVGEKEVAVNDSDVYDVAVSPLVWEEIQHDKTGTYKAKVRLFFRISIF